MQFYCKANRQIFSIEHDARSSDPCPLCGETLLNHMGFSDCVEQLEDKKVWVLEVFGVDGFRSTIQVFESGKGDAAAIEYVKMFGEVDITREVANGQKRIIVRLSDNPKLSYRFTEFEVKS